MHRHNRTGNLFSHEAPAETVELPSVAGAASGKETERLVKDRFDAANIPYLTRDVITTVPTMSYVYDEDGTPMIRTPRDTYWMYQSRYRKFDGLV
ncbi:MAG: hypothetical protein ACO32S_05575 [Steroidobacteraceae bacterium]